MYRLDQFCNIIFKLRKEKGWTQVELAEKLQVSDKAVSKWEKDDAFPKRKIAPHVMGLCTERVQARGITLANDLIKISCALYIGNFCLLLQRFSNMMEVQSGI